MRTINIPGCEIKLYEDIDEMPVMVYNLFNEYSLKDHNIGSDIEAINRHFERLDFFLARKKTGDAIQERKNMQQTYWNIFNGINFPSLQFACLVHSINGKKVDDYSETGLLELLNSLSKKGLTQKMVRENIEESKKKS